MSRPATVDGLVDTYLTELSRALDPLPAERRHQIVAEVASHIAEGRAGLDDEDPAAVEALLARVGDPRAIAAEAGAYDAAPVRSHWVDRLAPWALLFGGFVFGVGWFVGLIALWASATWRLRDKLLGTLVLPGGLAGAYLLFVLPTGSSSCSGYSSPGHPAVLHCTTSGLALPLPVRIAVAVALVLAPIFTAVHLDRARRRTAATGRGWRGTT